MHNKIKAAALISGGLDSMLAAKIIIEQGVYVEGLNFNAGFSGIPKQQTYSSPNWVANRLNIKLHKIDVIEEYKDILINPQYGYGANLNPCLDCKIFFVKKAREWIMEHNFDFIITGEVIGQRPKSQRKDTLPIVAKDSTANDLLLRPLCARNLPITKPEKQGWVNREKLYKFSGRSRKPQIALAKQFGFENFPQPAGGCLLTDVKYCDKIKDLWKSRGCKDYSRDDIELLKVGRHIRPRPNFKMIIGREHAENEFLEKYKKKYTHLCCTSHFGPLVLIDGNPNQDDLNLAAKITARFGKGCNAEAVDVQIHPLNRRGDPCLPGIALAQLGGRPYHLNVTPLPAEQVLREWYI
jgi:tRNA U34 2-thiouridine synthase MnmA/TrmU